MHIPSHQVNNVLKAYKNLLIRKNRPGQGMSEADEFTEFSDKRRAVAEKITRDIANRIMASKRQDAGPYEPAGASEAEDESNQSLSGFYYNSLTADNEKMTRRLSLEVTDFLSSSLEQLTEENPSETDREEAADYSFLPPEKIRDKSLQE